MSIHIVRGDSESFSHKLMTISKMESILTLETTSPAIEKLAMGKPNFNSIWSFQAVQYEVSTLLLSCNIENKELTTTPPHTRKENSHNFVNVTCSICC